MTTMVSEPVVNDKKKREEEKTASEILKGHLDGILKLREEDRRADSIIDRLANRAMTTLELVTGLKYPKSTTVKTINTLLEEAVVERIEDSNYYRLTDATIHVLNEYYNSPSQNNLGRQLGYPDYSIDSFKYNISSMPECFFTEIPSVKRFAKVARGNVWLEQLVNDFRRLCYGHVLPNYFINPASWNKENWQEKVQNFQEAWQKEPANRDSAGNVKAPAPNIIKAIRAFLTYGIDIQINSKDRRIKNLDLVPRSEVGKYRNVRLTEEEFTKALAYIESEDCKELIKKTNEELVRVAHQRHW